MIRITTAHEPTNTTITVDGMLTGEGVQLVEISCVQALAEGRPVRLFLCDVVAIDERGRSLLRRLAGAGVDLGAKGIYSGYIVSKIKARSSEQVTAPLESRPVEHY